MESIDQAHDQLGSIGCCGSMKMCCGNIGQSIKGGVIGAKDTVVAKASSLKAKICSCCKPAPLPEVEMGDNTPKVSDLRIDAEGLSGLREELASAATAIDGQLSHLDRCTPQMLRDLAAMMPACVQANGISTLAEAMEIVANIPTLVDIDTISPMIYADLGRPGLEGHAKTMQEILRRAVDGPHDAKGLRELGALMGKMPQQACHEHGHQLRVAANRLEAQRDAEAIGETLGQVKVSIASAQAKAEHVARIVESADVAKGALRSGRRTRRLATAMTLASILGLLVALKGDRLAKLVGDNKLGRLILRGRDAAAARKWGRALPAGLTVATTAATLKSRRTERARIKLEREAEARRVYVAS